MQPSFHGQRAEQRNGGRPQDADAGEQQVEGEAFRHVAETADPAFDEHDGQRQQERGQGKAEEQGEQHRKAEAPRAGRSPSGRETDGHQARGEGGDEGGQEGELESEIVHEGHLRHGRRRCRQDCGRCEVGLAAKDSRQEVFIQVHGVNDIPAG